MFEVEPQLESIRESLEEIVGDGFLSDIKTYVLESTGGTFQGVWETATTIYNAVAPIGLILLVVYFLIDLMEGVTAEQINIEMLIKKFIKLVVGEILISNGMTLIQGFVDFGNGLANLVSYTYASFSSQDIIDTMMAGMSDYGFFEAIMFRAQLLIPSAAAWVIGIVVKVVCFSRVLELAARAMLSPIAVADIFSGGTRSSGFRYMKKILALCIQGVVLLAIAIGVSSIEAGVLGSMSPTSVSDGWGFILTTLAVNFTAISMMFKSLSIANDVAGV